MGRDNFDGQSQQITAAGEIKDARGDIEQVCADAAQQHSINRLQKYREFMEAGGEKAGSRYLVRGAELKCSCGSHTRWLNLPLCHGVYISGKPMIHEEDCKVGDGQNITAFGVCGSQGHPDKTPSWIKYASILTGFSGQVHGFVNTNEDRKKILLQKEDGTNVKGFACTPCIVSGWKDVHEAQRIARNNTDGKKLSDRLAAVTEDSFLVCAYGGLIEPVTSGQEGKANIRTEEEGAGRNGGGHAGED